MTASAADLRAEAVARLCAIAGFPNADVGLVMARGTTKVQRMALRAAAGDQLLLEEVRMLAGVARGEAVALDDAIHQHGLPMPTPDGPQLAAATDETEDLATVLEEITR